MNTAMPTTGDLYLVVGYDGSAPAIQAGLTATRLTAPGRPATMM